MSIKRLAVLIGLFTASTSCWAVTNGQVAISSGTAFYGVDVSSMSNNFVRQNIVIGDPNTVAGVAPVDAIGGLSVRLSTGTAIVGSININQPTVLGTTTTFPSPQQVYQSSAGVFASTMAAVIINQPTIANTGFNVNNTPAVTLAGTNINTLYQPTVIGATVTYNGTQQIIVTQPTVLGATVTYNGTQTVNVATGGVSASMILNGPAGAATPVSWAATISSVPVSIQNATLATTQSGSWTQAISTGGVSASMMINGPAGTPTPVSYAATVSSVPVAIQNASLAVTQATPSNLQTYATLIQAGSEVLAASVTISGNAVATPVYTYSVNPETAPLVVQSIAGVDTAVGFQAGGASVPVTINGVTTTGTSLNINVTGGNSITSNFVNITTATVDQALPSVVQIQGVQGPTGLAALQRTDASSNTYVIEQVLVSSNTSLPATAADGSSTTALGDNEGRHIMMSEVPTTVLLATSPVISNSGYAVLVASPAATVFTHLVGCVWRNTSATSVAVDICNTGNCSISGTQDVPIEAVTADVRGIWPVGLPPLNTTAGGVQISAKVSAAVSTLNGYCQYWQSTSQ